MLIYYDSRTGNVKRFVNKIKQIDPSIIILHIQECNEFVNECGHLVTYTTGRGEVPKFTEVFVEKNYKFIRSVSSSGNMNWGRLFANAADIISDKFKIGVLLKFELSGKQEDARKFINEIKKLDKVK